MTRQSLEAMMEQMGVNIVRWREDQRMILAKLLLQSTRTPIAKIASHVGYDDQMYFSRVFRKRVGTSPSEFRRNSEAPPAFCEIPTAPESLSGFDIHPLSGDAHMSDAQVFEGHQ